MSTNAGASTYLENKVLDFTLRNQAFASPTTVYVGFFSDLQGTAELGGSQGGYLRKAVTFAAPSGGQCTSTNTMTWTASTDWGPPVQGVGIFDALTAGNLLFFGAMNAAVTVKNGDTPHFDSSNTITCAGIGVGISTYLANALLNHILRNTAYTPVATVYAALYSNLSQGTELSSSQGGYTRKSAAFSAAANGQVSNSGTISWTASNDWGPSINGVGITDNSATGGGNVLYSGLLSGGFGPVANTQIVSFAAASLVIPVQ